MIRILFVCHGNICRSPMAEFCMKDLVRHAGREAEFEIASAALHTDEIGRPVYPPAPCLNAILIFQQPALPVDVDANTDL